MDNKPKIAEGSNAKDNAQKSSMKPENTKDPQNVTPGEHSEQLKEARRAAKEKEDLEAWGRDWMIPLRNIGESS